MPAEEIKILRKENIESEIHDAESDVHLIVEEEDIESFDFDNGFISDDLDSEGDELDDIEEIDEDFEEDPLDTALAGELSSNDSPPELELDDPDHPQVEEIKVQPKLPEVEWSDENVDDFMIEDLATHDLEDNSARGSRYRYAPGTR